MIDMTNDDKPFESGELIEFCGDRYEVVANYGSSGKVKCLGESDVFSFHWVFEGEPCRRVESQGFTPA